MGAVAGIVGAVGAVGSAAKGFMGGGHNSAGNDYSQYDALLRQQESQLWGDLPLPDLKATPYQGYQWLQDYVPETYTPWEGQAYGFQDDQASLDAQRQSLGQLQEYAKGGLQPADIYALQNIGQQQTAAGTSAAQSAADQLRTRGLGGSGAEYAAQLAANQQSSNQSQNLYNSAFQAALNRQLTATTQSGTQAGNIRQQSDTVAKQMADINNAFNTQVQQLRTNAAMNSANVRNQAQAANLAGKQQVAQQNVDTGNRNLDLQNQIGQQQFNNQLQKLSGQTNALNNQATYAGQQANAAAQQALGNSNMVTNGLTNLASSAKMIGDNWKGSDIANWFGSGSSGQAQAVPDNSGSWDLPTNYDYSQYAGPIGNAA